MNVEGVLRRERLILVAALAVLTAIALVYTVAGPGIGMSATDMSQTATLPETAPPTAGMGAMTLASADWGPGYAALVFLMWWIMMVAMMIPSAAPTVLLHAAVRRRNHPGAQVLAESANFVGGYLLVWALFSLVATGLQWLLERNGLVLPMIMTLDSRILGVAVLLVAGIYQLTPFKHVCLDHCRSPADWLARHHTLPVLRKGIAHGAYCLGCCWSLMLLLFLGGIMNLYWIFGLAVLVIAEKLLPHGDRTAKAAGVTLIAAACWLALIPFT